MIAKVRWMCVLALVVLLALAGSVAGALYPALRAAACDPVDALAYE